MITIPELPLPTFHFVLVVGASTNAAPSAPLRTTIASAYFPTPRWPGNISSHRSRTCLLLAQIPCSPPPFRLPHLPTSSITRMRLQQHPPASSNYVRSISHHYLVLVTVHSHSPIHRHRNQSNHPNASTYSDAKHIVER
jgi:hypothetical protein